MPQEVSTTDDSFFTLLTDALRAGPGSPQWRDAVAQLKTNGEPVDEYRLLIEARESLESGKDYRSVRAGPGFTRKLLTHLEHETQRPQGKGRFPTATVIAALSAAAILALLAVVAYQLYPRGTVSGAGSRETEELAHTYFATETNSATFDGTIPMTWRKIGSLVLDVSGGLRPGPTDMPSGSYLGGGLVAGDPIPSTSAFAVQVDLRVNKTGDDLIAQVFVSNSDQFSEDRATSAHELVWSLRDRQQEAVVNGGVEAHGQLLPRPNQSTAVKILVGSQYAIVEAGGKRLWAGPHHLGDAPRFVGVRFIRTAGNQHADVIVQSVHLLTPTGTP